MISTLKRYLPFLFTSILIIAGWVYVTQSTLENSPTFHGESRPTLYGFPFAFYSEDYVYLEVGPPTNVCRMVQNPPPYNQGCVREVKFTALIGDILFAILFPLIIQIFWEARRLRLQNQK